jgi:hypothetical protein
MFQGSGELPERSPGCEVDGLDRGGSARLNIHEHYRLDLVTFTEVQRYRRSGVSSGHGPAGQRLGLVDMAERCVGDGRDRRDRCRVYIADVDGLLAAVKGRAADVQVRGEDVHVPGRIEPGAELVTERPP